MISSLMLENISADLKNHYSETVEVSKIESLQGGDINAAYLLKSTDRRFVLKINYNNRYPRLFENEANGIQELSKSGFLKTPNIISHGVADYESYILMEFIEKAPPKNCFWDDFGRGLGKMHKTGNNTFGFYEDNYIGTLIQHNSPMTDWTDFFVERRLAPLITMAEKRRLVSVETRLDFEVLFRKLDELIPKEAPSLLHGDLWSGNFLCGVDGPVLIDPAVYYGHREMDIAMTKLFGGFDSEFYKYYNEEYPLIEGWENRIEIHNLYPLPVHLNLFGLSYLGSIKSTLKSYI